MRKLLTKVRNLWADALIRLAYPGLFQGPRN
jgi:hypothetical protein